MYSLQQKECPKSLDEKVCFFLWSILYASTYGIYRYMVKIKNVPRLVCGHRPPRAATTRFALTLVYTVVPAEEETVLIMLFVYSL